MNCRNIPELPENIKYLINLRFLRFCSDKIKQLPVSISLLHNLDTLSIEFCSKLEKLPRSIEQLTNLRVLKLSEDFVCNLPSGIGKLTNLITLNGQFKVMGSDMILEELRDMNRPISGLVSISGLKNVGNIEYSRKANLVSKPNLRELILNFEEDDIPCKSSSRWRYKYPCFYIALSSSTNAKNENDEKIQEGVLESLQPHGNLTNLVILNYGGRGFPPWLLDSSLMSKLTTLTLHFHMELTFLPPLLDQLPHLKSLKIYVSGDTVTNDLSKQPAAVVSFSSCKEPSLKKAKWQAGDEPCLKKLTINNCSKLWKVTIPQKVEVLEVKACGCQEIKFSSPSELKKLSISNCRELITIYYKSGDLPFLESISLSGCPNLSMLSAIPQKVEVLEVNACGCQEIKFSSPTELKKLSISNCRELIIIDYKSGNLPFLESISLSGCPNLSMLSTIPQKVEVLEVNASGCQEIKLSSPSELKKLSISNCRELIKKLKVAYCPILQFPWKDLLPSVTHRAEIYDCPKMDLGKRYVYQRCTTTKVLSLLGNNKIHLSHASVNSTIPLLDEFFTLSFTKEDFREVESLTWAPLVGVSCQCTMLNLASLVILEISMCTKVKSVEGLDNLRNLKRLSISYCPELCNWNDKILPLSLSSLRLCSCDQLSSFPLLWVQNHSNILKVLVIKRCPRLALLEGFHCLTKLETVNLLYCRNISISPATESLQFRPHFTIGDCPLVKDWCQKNNITYYQLTPIDNPQDDIEAEQESAGTITKG